jgi:hypothetical protein
LERLDDVKNRKMKKRGRLWKKEVIEKICNLISEVYDLLRESEKKLDEALYLGEEYLDQDLQEEIEEIKDLITEQRLRVDDLLDELYTDEMDE